MHKVVYEYFLVNGEYREEFEFRGLKIKMYRQFEEADVLNVPDLIEKIKRMREITEHYTPTRELMNNKRYGKVEQLTLIAV